LESSSLPTGTVTFLFTDIEGSTPLWESRPNEMSAALQIHNTVLRQAIQAYGGIVFKVVGDAFQAVFPIAAQALQAAVAAQHGLLAAPWNELGPLKVRMGLHTGEAALDPGGDEYAVSHSKNRVARIMSAGHGGQILLSKATEEFLGSQVPAGITISDLGEYHLKGLSQPEHLFMVLAPDLPSDFPALASSEPPHNLPVPGTPFFGREAELQHIESLLDDPACRLITLVGIGGTGKTRLAIEAARRSHAYNSRAYFVALASATCLGDMLSAIAEAIRYSFFVQPGMSLSARDAQIQLSRYLTGKSALLILDNFEQLSSCAEFLAEFMTAVPGAKLLVTSRERLNLPGEWVIEIGGLSFPADHATADVLHFPAVQLFLKAAERVGYKNGSDWTSITRICRMLEGTPLGLEMAAASVKLLSIHEIADEIERSLDFLNAGWRSVPERHQTLRAVFETSWQLLTTPEQDAFARLAVFHSGFQREAAVKVTKATLPVLSVLVDKSFIRRNESGRFEIHPVLKHYAQEKLLANPAAFATVRAAHALFFSDWLCQMFAGLKGRDQAAALADLRSETLNIRAALRELLQLEEFERLERICPAVILFFEMNNQRVETREMLAILAEVEQNLRSRLASLPTSQHNKQRLFFSGLLALILSAVRHFSLESSPDEKNQLLIESLELAKFMPDTITKAYTLIMLCRGPGLESDQKLDLCRQSFVTFKKNNDRWGEALSQLIWADEMNFSDFDTTLAQVAYQASLETFNAAGNHWGQALCLNGLMVLEQKAGNYPEAQSLGNQSTELFNELKNFERVSWIHHSMGEFAIAHNHPEDACQHYEANVTYFAHVGDNERRIFYETRLAQVVEQLSRNGIY
jgi:predicted ATPase/class 3 adenylate cyclase